MKFNCANKIIGSLQAKRYRGQSTQETNSPITINLTLDSKYI